jgi:hypothetical protein
MTRIMDKKEFLELQDKIHEVPEEVFIEINLLLDAAANKGNVDFITVDTKKMTDLMVIRLYNAIKSAGYYANIQGSELRIGLK